VVIFLSSSLYNCNEYSANLDNKLPRTRQLINLKKPNSDWLQAILSLSQIHGRYIVCFNHKSITAFQYIVARMWRRL
jgi:hypothetical protein